ncbi:hypothetical protein ACFYSH_25055 [Streptomyces sp. NPDC005791]|uniref:hypothetical protein n=1 Tax=Streptomyces sp. NPDC005791 TaxID=3364732 RepID=UPI0036856F48
MSNDLFVANRDFYTLKREGGKLMDLKKELKDTPQGQMVMLAVELVKTAKDLSFEKKEDGGGSASATFNTTRVEVGWGGSAGFSLRFSPVKTIPGEVKGKSPRKH